MPLSSVIDTRKIATSLAAPVLTVTCQSKTASKCSDKQRSVKSVFFYSSHLCTLRLAITSGEETVYQHFAAVSLV